MTTGPGETAAPVDALRGAGQTPGSPVALACAPGGFAMAHGGRTWWWAADTDALAAAVGAVTAECAPRWVWWSATAEVTALVEAGVRLSACWDLGAAHLLLYGGSRAEPARVWAATRDLDPDDAPSSGQLDLLGVADDGGDGHPDEPVRPDGYLRPDWAERGPRTPAAAARWAGLALAVRDHQEAALAALPDTRPVASAPPLGVLTAWSESAAAVLAVELEAYGLPLDRTSAVELIARHAGPPPTDPAATDTSRRERDSQVLQHLPEGTEVDLRNPAQVRAMLARIGIDVADTRSWRLEPFRDVHPAVPALLAWRKSERIATTYGYGWLERHVRADGRLRGAWHGSDGAAGRMTAQSGLHNLPAELRPAVAAEPGHVLVRADLGQIEPRVLAAVSHDDALARATADPDLYAPVAARLGCDRPTAKVAVLAAMYGQTSGTAGAALKGLDRAYPVAMAFLRAADERGKAGDDVRTYGGRRVAMWHLDVPEPAAVASRGRFARNAVVQGAAAELFKMWAVTVRAGLPSYGGQIVLCLHDELLVHAPKESADDVVGLLHSTLDATAGRWAPGSGVRLVADVRVVNRWSDAKD
jgi:DNA polymerase-1